MLDEVIFWGMISVLGLLTLYVGLDAITRETRKDG